MHPVLFFAKSLKPQGRPRSTLCCFLQGFLYPGEARSRPCAVFYKHFSAPGTAAGLRRPTATAGTARQVWRRTKVEDTGTHLGPRQRESKSQKTFKKKEVHRVLFFARILQPQENPKRAKMDAEKPPRARCAVFLQGISKPQDTSGDAQETAKCTLYCFLQGI